METAYVMSVKQNAVNVLITQFGMEGLIFFNELEKDVQLDEENCLVEVNGKFGFHGKFFKKFLTIFFRDFS